MNKQEIIELVMSKPNYRRLYFGQAMIELNPNWNSFNVEYHGNMGSGVDNIDACIAHHNFPAIEVLKEMFEFEETGSPDYIYNIIFKLN